MLILGRFGNHFLGMVCAKPCNLHVFLTLSENIVFYRVLLGGAPAAEHPPVSDHNQAEALERGRGEVNLSPLVISSRERGKEERNNWKGESWIVG